ncbi:hypothetical protein GCM10025771_14670 [Niveibacterium umoris]|uniref:OOP family OmpA-OmpF porin n=1 Tax=Niveibacterium umoris TaxID=1193620 RepID=A0A840BTC9_9RHOO|nr:porin family protein [Niveibacterium umoris]MBB4014659.1 OOP family OmpA-OmpF porin [Niveibacterium umoris]
MKKILLVALLATFGASAHAAPVSESGTGAYVGVGVGLSYHDTGFDNVSGDTGYKFFGGYMFTRNLGAEVGYAHTQASGTVYACEGGCYGVNLKTTVDTYYGALVAVIPLGDNFALSAKVGLASNSAKADASLYGYGASASESKSGGMYGLGARYKFTPNFAIGAEYEGYASDTALGSVNVQYAF